MEKPDTEFFTSSPDIKITPTEIAGLLIFEKKLYPDQRGWFNELYRVEDIAKGLNVEDLVIKQGAVTYNLPKSLRGLHAEPQYKLVTPLTGKCFVAIADIRENSPTFGKALTFNFDYTRVDENGEPLSRRTLILSPGLANSILVSGDQPVLYHYAVSETYKTSEGKRAIRFNDPDLNIDWPIKDPIISEDDKKHPYLRDLFPHKF